MGLGLGLRSGLLYRGSVRVRVRFRVRARARARVRVSLLLGRFQLLAKALLGLVAPPGHVVHRVQYVPF